MTGPLHFLARATVPLARPLAGHRLVSAWGVVVHRGRSSGRPYSTPVAVTRTADGFVIPITFGDRTQWAKNVLASGGCRLRWAGREYDLVEPEVLDRSAGMLAFNRVERAMLGPTRIDRYLHLRAASSPVTTR